MGIFIIEDDETMIEILQDVIEDHELGEVLGHSTNATADLDLILSAGADIILVDFLMPGRDGAEIVRELKSRGCGAKFIMISQVSSKDMIGKAYDAGIEFFISKPINIIEVKSVITTVMQQIRNERTISQLRNMFLQELDPVGVTRSQPKPAASPAEKPKAEPEPVARQEESFQKTVTAILGRIGMSGEKGSADIVDVCVYMHTHGKSMNRESIREICAYFTDAPKSMEQRMRRAIATGLTNLAHLGIEDFMNDLFTEYSSTLFPFEEVRAEMDYIRKKREYGGKTSIKKFIESLMLTAEREMDQKI